MAFSTANVRTSVFGDLKVTVGDWTGSSGDAAGSISVEGGRVYLSDFTNQNPSTPAQGKVPISISTSGSITTISVYNHEDVTTGRFIIIHS